jgi:hypothetical protein
MSEVRESDVEYMAAHPPRRGRKKADFKEKVGNKGKISCTKESNLIKPFKAEKPWFRRRDIFYIFDSYRRSCP